MSAKFEKQVSHSLRVFADSQRPPDDYIDEAKDKIEAVEDFLEKVFKRWSIPLDEFVDAGSVAKKVCINEPDFDITMKLLDTRPPFTDVLDKIEMLLSRYANNLGINADSIWKSKRTVHFEFKEGYRVDMLPAVADMSFEEILEEIQSCPEDELRYWSSSLVDSQVHFMKQQGSFAHSLARLAKYWFKKVKEYEDIHVVGGSTIFELMSVATSERSFSESGTESMIRALLLVMECVEKMDARDLKFSSQIPAAWILGPPGNCWVVESDNLTDNLLDGLKDDETKVLKRHAGIMVERLNDLLKYREFCNFKKNGSVIVDFDALFEVADDESDGDDSEDDEETRSEEEEYESDADYEDEDNSEYGEDESEGDEDSEDEDSEEDDSEDEEETGSEEESEEKEDESEETSDEEYDSYNDDEEDEYD